MFTPGKINSQVEVLDDDPFGILKATLEVVKAAQDVSINFINVAKAVKFLKGQISKGNLLDETQFGVIDKTERGVQLVFLEDTVNFCFWGEAGEEKWTVEYPKGKAVDGWFALAACFKRALNRGIPILEAEYLENLTSEKGKEFFKGRTATQIPLLEKRVKNLQEAGKVLIKNYEGHFKNVIETAGFDAVKLVKIIVNDFSSFNDVAIYRGRKIPFFKRAQICAYDLTLMSSNERWGKLSQIDKLTAFADYKLPQILRNLGVLSYSDRLSSLVDNLTPLSAGAPEEVEIRSATIWAIELLRQQLKTPATLVDNLLWKASQESTLPKKPYHRTRTIYY